ncbi:MAG: hypothetical protein AAF823_11665 [Planctomycetota bacterium]
MTELLVILRFSRRQLTERELAAWERRSKRPVVAAILFLAVVVIAMEAALLGIVSLAYFQGDEIHSRDITEMLIDGGVVGILIGFVVFVFWYSNGVSLYKRQKRATLRSDLPGE